MIELIVNSYQVATHSAEEVMQGISDIFNNPIDSTTKIFTILLIFGIFIILFYLLVKIIKIIWTNSPPN